MLPKELGHESLQLHSASARPGLLYSRAGPARASTSSSRIIPYYTGSRLTEQLRIEELGIARASAIRAVLVRDQRRWKALQLLQLFDTWRGFTVREACSQAHMRARMLMVDANQRNTRHAKEEAKTNGGGGPRLGAWLADQAREKVLRNSVCLAARSNLKALAQSGAPVIFQVWRLRAGAATKRRCYATRIVCHRQGLNNPVVALVVRVWHLAAFSNRLERVTLFISQLRNDLARSRTQASEYQQRLAEATRDAEMMTGLLREVRRSCRDVEDHCKRVSRGGNCAIDFGLDTSDEPVAQYSEGLTGGRSSRNALLQRRNGLVDELRGVATALEQATLELDDMEESMHPPLRPGDGTRSQSPARRQNERQDATRETDLARQECLALEDSVISLLRGLGETERSLVIADDKADAETAIESIRKVDLWLRRAAASESRTCDSLRSELAHLEGEKVRLQAELQAERSRPPVSAEPTIKATEVALVAERERSQSLVAQLKQEKERVDYLERLHQGLQQESLRQAGYEAELGTVARQVERLARDRKRIAAEAAWKSGSADALRVLGCDQSDIGVQECTGASTPNVPRVARTVPAPQCAAGGPHASSSWRILSLAAGGNDLQTTSNSPDVRPMEATDDKLFRAWSEWDLAEKAAKQQKKTGGTASFVLA